MPNTASLKRARTAAWIVLLFSYSVSGSRHSLGYVVVPPYGRRIYTFEDRKWTDVD